MTLFVSYSIFYNPTVPLSKLADREVQKVYLFLLINPSIFGTSQEYMAQKFDLSRVVMESDCPRWGEDIPHVIYILIKRIWIVNSCRIIHRINERPSSMACCIGCQAWYIMLGF